MPDSLQKTEIFTPPPTHSNSSPNQMEGSILGENDCLVKKSFPALPTTIAFTFRPLNVLLHF